MHYRYRIFKPSLTEGRARFLVSLQETNRGRGKYPLHPKKRKKMGRSNHFSFKRGKVGKGLPHAEYITGAAAPRNDVAEIGHGNMPSWATENPLLFWKAADQFERANGRAYHEFEIALPTELNSAEQKKLPDYVPTSATLSKVFLEQGFALMTATASLGSIATRSLRRLNRYCTSAR